jgi:hypothetical protein
MSNALVRQGIDLGFDRCVDDPPILGISGGSFKTLGDCIVECNALFAG